MHFIAAMRVMLGQDHAITKASAFSQQLQEHLPPVDTLDAILQTEQGASGTFSVSFGTTSKGSGYTVACEQGVVTVLRGKVTVEKQGIEEVFDFPDEGAGVKQEVLAWSHGIGAGTIDPRLGPAEALIDLRIVSLIANDRQSITNAIASSKPCSGVERMAPKSLKSRRRYQRTRGLNSHASYVVAGDNDATVRSSQPWVPNCLLHPAQVPSSQQRMDQYRRLPAPAPPCLLEATPRPAAQCDSPKCRLRPRIA